MGNHIHADTSSQGSGESLVDGTGLPSPGRWRSGDRDPPNDDIAIEVRQVAVDEEGSARRQAQEDDQHAFGGWLGEKPIPGESGGELQEQAEVCIMTREWSPQDEGPPPRVARGPPFGFPKMGEVESARCRHPSILTAIGRPRSRQEGGRGALALALNR